MARDLIDRAALVAWLEEEYREAAKVARKLAEMDDLSAEADFGFVAGINCALAHVRSLPSASPEGEGN